jgi:hypothetical protein
MKTTAQKDDTRNDLSAGWLTCISEQILTKFLI